MWFLLASVALASDPDVAGMGELFERIEQALRASDEAAFAAEWHPEGLRTNLVGGSGLTGSAVFEQGSRKHWFLKADLESLSQVSRGGAWIVTCDIWAWDDQRPVDRVHAVLGGHEQRWVLYGAGEELDEAKALASRVDAGEIGATPVGGTATPQGPVEALFHAAKTGELAALAGLCDPTGEGDGDVKGICALTADDPNLAEFREAFRDGALTGTPTVDGGRAQVPFQFGPGGRRSETMNVVERDGSWFLSSF